MTELKPCPFCSNTILDVGDEDCDVHTDEWYVECPVCGCITVLCKTKEEAMVKWNTRPSLWTTITDEASLPKESDTGNYCFIHNIHNDVCYRALWQHHWKCWVVEHDINDKYYPIKDIDMWMLNPIPYPTESSKYATE